MVADEPFLGDDDGDDDDGDADADIGFSSVQWHNEAVLTFLKTNYFPALNAIDDDDDAAAMANENVPLGTIAAAYGLEKSVGVTEAEVQTALQVKRTASTEASLRRTVVPVAAVMGVSALVLAALTASRRRRHCPDGECPASRSCGPGLHGGTACTEVLDEATDHGPSLLASAAL
jgi:hypothetical protein